jgi:hypothetical protein
MPPGDASTGGGVILGPDLSALLARVEAAEGPDREVDCDLGVALGLFMVNDDNRLGIGRGKSYVRLDEDGGATAPGQAGDMLVPDYTDSLDAALALCERVLPNDWEFAPKPLWLAAVAQLFDGKWEGKLYRADMGKRFSRVGATPALALLAAMLKALIATSKDGTADAELGPGRNP